MVLDNVEMQKIVVLHVPLLNVYPHVRRFRLDIAGTSHAIDWLVQ